MIAMPDGTPWIGSFQSSAPVVASTYSGCDRSSCSRLGARTAAHTKPCAHTCSSDCPSPSRPVGFCPIGRTDRSTQDTLGLQTMGAIGQHPNGPSMRRPISFGRTGRHPHVPALPASTAANPMTVGALAPRPRSRNCVRLLMTLVDPVGAWRVRPIRAGRRIATMIRMHEPSPAHEPCPVTSAASRAADLSPPRCAVVETSLARYLGSEAASRAICPNVGSRFG